MDKFSCLFTLLVTILYVTRAATVTYIGPNTGSTNNLWTNKDNWSSGALPTAEDDVIIAKAGTYTVTVDKRADCNSITVGDDQTSQIALNVLENLALHGNNSVGVIKAGATISLGGGNFMLSGPEPVFTVEGTLKWTSKNIESDDQDGTIIIASGGKLADISSNGACNLVSTNIEVRGDATFGNSNSPILNMESSKVTLYDASTFSVPANPNSLVIISSANVTDGSLLNITGGTFEISSTVKIESDLFVGPQGTVNVKQMSIETTCPRSLDETCTTFDGTLNIATGATFLVTRGMHMFTSTSKVTGTGLFAVQGPEIVHFAGSFGAGSKLLLKNPSVFYNEADGISYDTIEMHQASLFAGTHSAIIKTLDWQGGKIGILGQLTLDTIQLNPEEKTTPILCNGTTFQVNGKWTFLKAGFPLNFVDVVISIGSKAVMTIDQPDVQFIHTSGNNKLLVSAGGSLKVSSSCSWESYEVVFSGANAVTIEAGGTMSMTSVTMTAKESGSIQNDGSLTLFSSVANFGITTSIAGTGQYVLSGTTLNVDNGDISVGGALTTDTSVIITRDLSFPKGADPTVKIASLTVKGGKFQVINRALGPINVNVDFFNYEGGEIIGNSDNSLQPDITYNFGQSIISGGSNRKLTNAMVQLSGPVAFKATGNVQLEGVTTIVINDTFDVLSNMELVSDPNDPCNGMMHVATQGNVIINGTNQAIIQVNVINEGGIQVNDDGALTLKSTYTQKGVSSSLALSGGSVISDQAQIVGGDVSGYGNFIGALHLSGRIIPLYGPNKEVLKISGSLAQGANGELLCTLSATAGNLTLRGSIDVTGEYSVYGGVFSVESTTFEKATKNTVTAPEDGFATWGSFSGSGFSQVKNANLDATQGVAVNVTAAGISLSVTPMPKITSITPNTEGMANELVTIEGENFPNSLTSENVEVLFNKLDLCTELKIIAPNKITCLTPAGIGTVSVCITVDGRGCFKPVTSFSYALPHVSSISPKTDNTSGGAVINIFGDGFGDTAADISVMIGTEPCASVGIFEPGQLFCKVPPGIGVDLPVVVSLKGVKGTTSDNATFSYAAPRIDYVCPSNVKEGDTLRIFGQNFAYKFESKPNISVAIGGVACKNPTVVTVTPSLNQVTCVVPKGEGKQTLDFTASKQANSVPTSVVFTNGGGSTPSPKAKAIYVQPVFWVAVLGAALVFFIAGLLIGWRCLGKSSSGSYAPVAQSVQ